MSRMLSELLGVNEVLLSTDLKRLEDASAHPSHDVRLGTEILDKIRIKTKELGLDPADSTGRELYHALLSLVKLHDEFLVKKIGGSDPSDVADLLPRIRQAVLKMDIPRTAWVLKASVAKKLLKDCPPKRSMKYLGYKSLDSMLKREPIGELFGGMVLLEDRTWYEKFIKKYSGLQQMDFESRSIDVIQLDKKKWHEAASEYANRQRHVIMPLRELGVILVLPPPFTHRTGITITLLPQLLHHINEVRLYSAFYKLHQMRANFGEVIANSLLYDAGNHVYLADKKIHWRVVQRHIGHEDNKHHPEILEPHVQPEDLAWRKAEANLFRLEPALHFWHGTDYVGLVKSQRPISFNLMDMAINYLNGLHYEQRVYGHMRDSLWNELFIRYMGEQALESQALKQLDYENSTPALLALATKGK